MMTKFSPFFGYEILNWKTKKKKKFQNFVTSQIQNNSQIYPLICTRFWG